MSGFNYGPSKSYYFREFADLAENLRQNILIFGITSSFIVYLSKLIDGDSGATFSLSESSLFIAIFFVTIMFTAYDCIAGRIYTPYALSEESKTSSEKVLRSSLVTSTLALNILQFLVNAIIIAWPAVALVDQDVELHHILILNSTWHFLNIIWYCIEPVKEAGAIRKRDFGRHGSYCVALLFIWIYCISSNVYDISIFSIYTIYVLCIFRFQVNSYIQKTPEKYIIGSIIVCVSGLGIVLYNNSHIA